MYTVLYILYLFFYYKYFKTKKSFKFQLFLAIALPLELDDYSVFVSYNFEGNYNLPQNQTEFTYPPILGEGRSGLDINRETVYSALEHKLES